MSRRLPSPCTASTTRKTPPLTRPRYYSALARSYSCPHGKCKKSFQSVIAFVQHLKSPAHLDLQTVRCPQCLRTFPSVTALTQHIESQAIRCNARKLDHVDFLVEDITQVVTADGFHDDETVRYVNMPNPLTRAQATAAVLGGAQRVFEATRRAVDAQVVTKKEKAKKLHENQKW